MSAGDTSTTEVLVIGGGPTGLAAAVALGRLGVRTLLVERRATTSTHPRGHVENGRTMEIFRLWGVEEDVRAAGLPRSFLGGIGFKTRMAGTDLGSLRFDPTTEWLMGADGSGPAALSSTPQDRLEPILLDAARACADVEVRFGWAVDELSTSEDQATVRLVGPDGGAETVTAPFAIACDGPRSDVRRWLGIDTEGPGTLGAQLGIYFHADLAELVEDNPNALYWLYDPEVQGVVIPLDGRHRWHLLFAYDPNRESIEDYPPERCQAVVRALVGRPAVPIDIANARTLVESGLAGILVNDPDGFAAIEEPAGAAIREKMAQAIPGQLAHFAFDGLSFGYVHRSAAVLDDGTRAPESPVGTYVPTAAPGARAPHVWLRRGVQELSTIDLSDNRFVLLSAEPAWVEAARRAGAVVGVEVRALRVGPTEDADLLDPSGDWMDTYATGPRGAVLVRPDGHVAWRRPALDDDPEDTLSRVLSTVLHRV